MINLRQLTLIGIVLAAVIYRIIPHPFNFTPIIAMALFSGAKFSSKSLGLLIPLAAMLLSDVFLGLHQTMLFVYGALALIVATGFVLKKRQLASLPKGRAFTNVIVATFFSTGLFFIITNFGSWLVSDFYPKSITGLTESYLAAIPFLQNSLAGNLFFSSLFFGGFYLAEKQFLQLQESHS